MKINGVEIEPDTCYDPAVASKILKRKPSTLALDRCQGRGVEFIKIGRNIFYEGRAILAYIDRRRRPTDEHQPLIRNDRRKRARRSAEAKRGLEEGEYEALLQSQNGLCAICGEPAGAKRLSIDHDHETGSVRGLLCTLCNSGLGHFRDNEVLLRMAIDYLANTQLRLARQADPTRSS